MLSNIFALKVKVYS